MSAGRAIAPFAITAYGMRCGCGRLVWVPAAVALRTGSRATCLGCYQRGVDHGTDAPAAPGAAWFASFWIAEVMRTGTRLEWHPAMMRAPVPAHQLKDVSSIKVERT